LLCKQLCHCYHDLPKARPLILLAKEVGEIIQRHHETVDRAYALWLKDR